MTGPYKAVFFDLDGTLRLMTPSPTGAFIQFARSINIDIPISAERQVKRWAHYYWGQDKVVNQDMERLGADGFWVNYSRLLLEKVNAAKSLNENALNEHAQMVRDWFETEYTPQVKLAPGSYETLIGLKEQGYLLGLISNRLEPLDSVVAELGMGNIFHLTLAAGEVGHWKPDPVIFEHALSHFHNLAPHECIYVGDNYYADGFGANAAGIVPVIFDPENLYESSDFRRISQIGELLNGILA